MAGGHDNAHAGAGPTGITLNDLHVAAPERTSEPLSINRPLPSDAAIRRPQRFVFGNLVANLATLATHGFVVAGAILLSGLVLAELSASGTSLPPVIDGIAVLPGLSLAQLLIALLLTVPLYLLLEALPVLAVLRRLAPFRDSVQVPEDATVADVVKPRPADVHFGRLKVSYSITRDAIVVRSLGDRLVAVHDRNILRGATLGLGSAYIAWRGRHDTPPVVVELEADGYASRLIIHGAHFEGAGVDAAGSLKKAELFRDELRKIIPRPIPHSSPRVGGHGDGN